MPLAAQLPLSCEFGDPEIHNGKKQFTCERCEYVSPWFPESTRGMVRVCALPVHGAHGFGVGTELKSMLGEFGINSKAGCSCKAKAALMNKNGLDWCRSNGETVDGWLHESAVKAVGQAQADQFKELGVFTAMRVEALHRTEVKIADWNALQRKVPINCGLGTHFKAVLFERYTFADFSECPFDMQTMDWWSVEQFKSRGKEIEAWLQEMSRRAWGIGSTRSGLTSQ